MNQIVNPLEYPHWDELLRSHSESTFFHTASWARVLNQAYGYKPVYFLETENDRITGLLPLMGIKSALTGKRGVSLPFSDFCEPIAEDQAQFQRLMTAAISFGRHVGWSAIQLRGGRRFFDSTDSCEQYYAHILTLPSDERSLMRMMRPSTLRSAKKAKKVGVCVEFYNSHKAMSAFYRLNCMTRRRHHLPPQPWRFFSKVYKHIIAPRRGIIAIARHNVRPIAGAIFFHLGNRAIYKYGAMDYRAQSLRPHNLIFWQAIKWYCQNAFQKLHFGRTDKNHHGLRQFKSGWGTEEKNIKYYKYHLKENRYACKAGKYRLSSVLLRFMPFPVLKMAGNLFYKHIG